MQTDPEYIEQLILEEITGVITPENLAILKTLLEQDAEVYATRQRMHAVLTSNHVKAVREKLPVLLPVEQILTAYRKRKRRAKYIRIINIAASIVLILGIYKLLQPALQPLSPVSIPSSTLKNVALQLPGGQLILLGSSQQQIKAAGVLFEEKDGKLSWSGSATSSQPATIVVPPGKDYAVVLPDGSEIKLNAATSIQLPLAFSDTRDIAINGEAYLQIAKDESRPFRVHLRNSIVAVLGTAFNINTYDSSRTKVTLTSGAVKIITGEGSLQLQPGEESAWQPGQKPLANPVDTTAALAWRNGYYNFDKATIQEIRQVIARVYGIRVVIDAQDLATATFTSMLEKSAPLEQFLERLKVIPVNYRFEKGDSVLHLIH